MSLPTLNTPSLSVPSFQNLLYVPRLKGPKVGESNYIGKQEERLYAKDLGDIILGNPLTGTKQLRETLKKHGAIDLIYVPILNRVAGTLFMIKDRTVDPLIKGDITTAFINSLETVGSTLELYLLSL